MKRQLQHRRRGMVYLVVLAAAMLMTIMAVGAITVARVQLRTTNAASHLAEARICARSGLQIARLWIDQDPNWRTNRTSGTWSSSLNVGSGTVSISVVDPNDGNLSNNIYDPITITVVGAKGLARHTLKQTLQPTPMPLVALQYAMHVGGQIHVYSGENLHLNGATLSTNADLRNDNYVDGNARLGLTQTSTGTTTGTVLTNQPVLPMPDHSVISTYAAMGTVINTPSTVDRIVLSPWLNPYGTPNPNGIYVIQSTTNITLRNLRVYGTLVIQAPGKKVTIDNVVCMQTYRSDMPALIIDGDVLFNLNSGSLSELLTLVNYNPSGAPYNGVTDFDILDTYPSEIKGLVHITGKVTTQGNPVTIRGAVICESAAATDAFYITQDVNIYYDPGLYTNPPLYYVQSIRMTPVPGSLVQVVN